MAEKHLVVCSVGAEDIDKARETIDAMCRHAMMGHIIPGFGIDDSLQYMCNSHGIGDPIYYLCFIRHTEFYIKLSITNESHKDRPIGRNNVYSRISL